MIWILTKHDESEYENRRLIEEFKLKNITALLVSPKHFDLIIETNHSRVLYKGLEVQPKIILVRTGSGTDFFTSCVLKQLELQNVICINSVESIEISKDKLSAAQYLSANNIPTPKTILVHFPVDIKLIKREIGFPCVVKLLSGSYGKGVHLCKSMEEFQSFTQFIDAIDSKKTIIVQKFMDSKIGTDLRVWYINGEVIGAMQRSSGNEDFRANISNGGYGEPYKLNEKIIEITKKAAETIGLNISGVDLLFDNDDYVVCELNSSPGFLGMDSFCNMNIAEKIVDYVVSFI
jgi:RimK family alpha-L-glutamate ligase